MNVLRGTIHDSLCMMHILRGILILLCFLQTGELLGDEGMPSGWVGGGVGTNLSGLSRIDPKNMFPKIFLQASTCYPPRHYSFHFATYRQAAAVANACSYCSALFMTFLQQNAFFALAALSCWLSRWRTPRSPPAPYRSMCHKFAVKQGLSSSTR